jgi:hypothetical protein
MAIGNEEAVREDARLVGPGAPRLIDHQHSIATPSRVESGRVRGLVAVDRVLHAGDGPQAPCVVEGDVDDLLHVGVGDDQLDLEARGDLEAGLLLCRGEHLGVALGRSLGAHGAGPGEQREEPPAQERAPRPAKTAAQLFRPSL